MIPDFDAVHTWNGEFSINRLWEPGGMLNFPRVRITDLPGFHSLPEGEDKRDLPIGVRFRELPRKGYRSGKSLVYSGSLEAQNEDDLNQLEDDFTAAFQELDQGTMVVEQFGTGDTYFYVARCTALTIDGNPPASMRSLTFGYERTFNLGLRMLDGRFFEDAINTVEGDAAPDNTATMDVGKVPTEPVVTLRGAAAIGSYVESVEQSARITLKAALAAGESLVIDFNDRSVTHSNQVAWPGDSYDVFIDDLATDWWDRGVYGLARGMNTVIFHGGAASGMSLSWHKAHLG